MDLKFYTDPTGGFNTGTVPYEEQITTGSCPVTTLKPIRIAILVRGGMVFEVRSSDPYVEVAEVVDADFVCCNPEEKWNNLKHDIPFKLYEVTSGIMEDGGIS